MRKVVIGMAIVALVALPSGCGTSHPAATSTTAPTHAQIVAAAQAKAAAAAKARQVAKAAAKARALGYTIDAENIAGYKLAPELAHRKCGEFGNHGCWRVVAVTLTHCPFFEMDVNELRKGAIVETYVDNQSDVQPLTPITGKFDATEDNVTLGKPFFTCNATG